MQSLQERRLGLCRPCGAPGSRPGPCLCLPVPACACPGWKGGWQPWATNAGGLSSWWSGVQGTHCWVSLASHHFAFPPGSSQVGMLSSDSHESGGTRLLLPLAILGSLGARQGKKWIEAGGTGSGHRWKVPKTKAAEDLWILESKDVGFAPSPASWVSAPPRWQLLPEIGLGTLVARCSAPGKSFASGGCR